MIKSLNERSSQLFDLSNASNLFRMIVKEKTLILLAFTSLIPLILVRFLPVYDYPHWVFQAHVINKFHLYAQWYELNWFPVPNWGSTLPLMLLAPIFGAEFAGKVLLAGYVFFMVIAFAYFVRGAAGISTPTEYIAPLLVYNYFFYNGFLSYMVGLPILLLTFGFLLRITHKLTPHEKLVLSIFSVIAYLCHLFIWIPIFIYLLILVFPLRAQKFTLLVTQIIPLILFLSYLSMRMGRDDISIQYYQSFYNKLYALLIPLSSLQRVDPFTPPFPILAANGIFLLGILIFVSYKIDFFRFSKKHIPLLLTMSCLLGIAICNPFTWLGGMGELDQRLVFSACLILLSLLGALSVKRRVRWPLLLSISLLMLHAILFLAVDGQLQIIYQAIQRTLPKQNILVASFRRPPVYGECLPHLINNGGGVFVLQWFPLYLAIEQGGIPAHTFSTAALREKPGMEYAMNFGIFQEEREKTLLMDEINQSEQNEYLVLFGCPGDIQLIRTEVGFDFDILGQGAYFMIIRRLEPTAD